MINESVPLLAKLFNASVSSGIVPSAFKEAKVRPLLNKTGLDPNLFKNYRLVSNLPFLSKILEKIVLAILSRPTSCWQWPLYTSAVGLPIKPLYGNCLVELVNDPLCSADEGKNSVLALLDLSSAFDTIDHEVC